ncbi:G-type lectin S-receptor-like serine/threonine-protein kinase At4g03230 [Quercus robur]|uniref:G-type lectin S-receptor-like serine/threonine-protein kinase At4g03230 n=1 Tax=Quercus robur TaxID=38942 RepID=UPI002162F011|nr:G-type lectin S-receptor-like serine/threonine-protein kinase At4g03230 [Quercus robur]
MNNRISPLIAFLLLFFSLGFQSTYNTVTDTILPGQSLTHPETIVSPNGIFELCFYSPGNSTKYYLAIRFKNVSEQSVVWVANRKYPFPDSTAALNINQDGDLAISDGTMTYAMTNTSAGNGTYAMLLDTGNLILTNRVLELFWQSFDYPTDTLLPGMKLIVDNASLISWKSREDPAPGHFYLQLGLNIYSTVQPIIKIMKGSEVYWTSLLTSFDVLSCDWGYVSWPINYTSQTQISRIVLHESGKLKLQSWLEDKKKWNSTLQSSRCGDYALCGNFSVCNETAHEPCSCLPGFKPVSAGARSKGGVSSDCVRKTALQCSKNNSDIQNDVFLLMSNVDWLDNPKPLEMSSNKECQSSCLNSCSCIAYAFEEKFGPNRTKSVCIEWHGSFSYLKLPSIEDKYGNDFYLKLDPLESGTHGPSSRNESNSAATPGAIDGVMLVRAKQLVAILSLPLATLLLGLFVYCVWKKLRMTSKGEDLVQLDLGMTIKSENSELLEENKSGDIRKKEVKMPLFSFTSVSAATDNFSDANKLGEGGFGPVYKGILLKGDLVAVKRLSRRSGQGWEELKNEAMLIAKLQHNNLVRLFGCCIERDEKILVYEYMPNKSLDFFIFDQEKRKILDWQMRIRVIEGVAQGLLYLHQYSRLRIIHRDLKASNILLDTKMNPKISDFGLARIFEGNESQANTNRIVGTYGYMSPEYALEGLFSIKSDVFSFGVLLLEIVSGRKNTGFYQTDSFHLLGYAWELWTSDRGSELVDPLLDDVSSVCAALKYVNIGLLCVQESAADRPTMSDVVAMLSSESTALPYPKQPAFLTMRSVIKANPGISRTEICSVNHATVSIIEGR